MAVRVLGALVLLSLVGCVPRLLRPAEWKAWEPSALSHRK